MNQAAWLEMASGFARLTKTQLVDHLIARGQIYPSRGEMMRWSKDELVASASDLAVAHIARMGGAA